MIPSAARTLRIGLGLLPILVLITAATASASLLIDGSASSIERGLVRGLFVLSLCSIAIVVVTIVALVGRWALGEMERTESVDADQE